MKLTVIGAEPEEFRSVADVAYLTIKEGKWRKVQWDLHFGTVTVSKTKAGNWTATVRRRDDGGVQPLLASRRARKVHGNS